MALVVSYGGANFRLHKIQMFHKKDVSISDDSRMGLVLMLEQPLKQVERAAIEAVEYAKIIYDENGKQTGVDMFRPVYDENGKVIGEEKIDKEAEKKLQEESAESEEEDFCFEDGEVVGEDESEAAAEEEAARELAEERKGISEKYLEIYHNTKLSEEQKRKAMDALLASMKMQTTTTTLG